MRIGIFGGTFNPIHYGHLVLAETARESLALDRVVLIPTRQPPHKSTRGLLPGSVRLELIQRAIRDNAAFVASDIELQRPDVSYSIETVRALRAQLPDAKLFLLIGEDMLGVRWLGWDELTRLCTVVVAHRAGQKKSRQKTKVKWLPMPVLDISSSDIRARLRAGRSIRYLVPPSVEHHIRHHHLYSAGGNG